MLCSYCARDFRSAGYLCLEPKAWAPAETEAVCRECTEERERQRAALARLATALAADDADWWAHLAVCGFCSGYRGSVPRYALMVACRIRSRRAA